MYFQPFLQHLQIKRRIRRYASDGMGFHRLRFHHRRTCGLPGRKSSYCLCGKNGQKLLYAEPSSGPLFSGGSFQQSCPPPHCTFCPPCSLSCGTKQHKDENALATIRNIFSARTRDFITALDDSGIIVVRELQSTESYEELNGIACMLVDMLNTEAMTSAWVSYSNVADDIMQLSDAYKEARTALEVGKIFYADKNVFGYNRLGIGRLIYQLPTQVCDMFVGEIFGEESLDSIDDETLNIIRTFFENNLNLSETSRQLYVHRNTLVYRFEKLQKRFGLDIRTFEDALAFKLAMMVSDYITYSRNHGK